MGGVKICNHFMVERSNRWVFLSISSNIYWVMVIPYEWNPALELQVPRALALHLQQVTTTTSVTPGRAHRGIR